MRGFTVVEMMLSVALLSIVFAMSYSLYAPIAYQGDLDISVRSSQALLRKAALLSSAVEGDSTWGVRFESTEVILFKGTSYAARDDSYDETLDLLGSEVSGAEEYVFEKVSGQPQSGGSTVMFSPSTGESQEINVNEKGTIIVE